MMKMRHSFEQSGNEDDEYDAKWDFLQILEAAKINVEQVNKDYAYDTSAERSRISGLNEEKKTKKKSWKSALSWKNALFFWRSSTNSTKQEAASGLAGRSRVQMKRTAMSGPIPAGSVQHGLTRRSSRPASGPLASLFAPTKELDTPPYMYLGQSTLPACHKAYGPLYFVS